MKFSVLFFVGLVAARFGVDLNVLFDPIHYLRVRAQKKVRPEGQREAEQNRHASEN